MLHTAAFTLLHGGSFVRAFAMTLERTSVETPSSAFSCSRVIHLSRNGVPHRSLLAFARANLALWRKPYLAHYKSAFAFSVILYPQPCRLSLRIAFPEGELRAYRVSCKQQEWGRFRLYTGNVLGYAVLVPRRPTYCVAFGSSLSVLLACRC